MSGQLTVKYKWQRKKLFGVRYWCVILPIGIFAIPPWLVLAGVFLLLRGAGWLVEKAEDGFDYIGYKVFDPIADKALTWRHHFLFEKHETKEETTTESAAVPAQPQ